MGNHLGKPEQPLLRSSRAGYCSQHKDTGPAFDPVRALAELLRCQNRGDDEVTFDHPLERSPWRLLEIGIFEKHVARKTGHRLLRSPHTSDLGRRRGNWCYGYQGHVYEYYNVPDWPLLLDRWSDSDMMQYVLQSKATVRSVQYEEPNRYSAGQWLARLHKAAREEVVNLKPHRKEMRDGHGQAFVHRLPHLREPSWSPAMSLSELGYGLGWDEEMKSQMVQ